MPSFPLILSQWKYRKRITIDGSKIDANLTDFPVAVILNSSRFDFSKARSDGFDIRFTDANGNLLKYERERHDAQNQVAEYWVKIPSVLSGQNTIFYIYYGNPNTSDGADPTNVWDSNFKAVWHMKDYTTSQILDSTSNNNTGNKKGANEPLEVEAKIGKGQSFDGTNDKITVNDNSSLYFYDFTFTAWIKTGSVSGSRYILEKDIVGTGTHDYEWKVTNNELRLTIGVGGSNYHCTSSGANLGDNNWHFVVGVRSGGNLYLWKDGVLIAQASCATGQVDGAGVALKIGYGWESPSYWQGLLDEITMSNIARSAAWIKASYHSGNDSLLSFGEEEKRSSIVPMFFIR